MLTKEKSGFSGYCSFHSEHLKTSLTCLPCSPQLGQARSRSAAPRPQHFPCMITFINHHHCHHCHDCHHYHHCYHCHDLTCWPRCAPACSPRPGPWSSPWRASPCPPPGGTRGICPHSGDQTCPRNDETTALIVLPSVITNLSMGSE